jgi:hypothetical protein
VGRIAAPEVMALDDARKSAAFADADYVHFFLGLKFVRQHPIARLQIAVGAFKQPELAQELHALAARLLQVTGLGFRDAGFLGVFHQPQLHGVIPVRGGRFALHHDTGTGLEHRDRHHLAIRTEHLRHPDLLT